jgi:hypothetical protein
MYAPPGAGGIVLRQRMRMTFVIGEREAASGEREAAEGRRAKEEGRRGGVNVKDGFSNSKSEGFALRITHAESLRTRRKQPNLRASA